MSEVERRRRYKYDAVHIETARILDPQFNDAVIYVTGAQIEMLRNVSHYLARRGTYVSEYQPGYYLTPTDEDYDDIQEIVADLEETLMGNPNTIWGYTDRYLFEDEVISSGAGNTYLYSDVVPAGYVYRIEHWTIGQWSPGTCGMRMQVFRGTYSPRLFYAPAVPSGDLVYDTTSVTLKEGDRIELQIVGLPSGNNAIMVLWGFKMKVPE